MLLLKTEPKDTLLSDSGSMICGLFTCGVQNIINATIVCFIKYWDRLTYIYIYIYMYFFHIRLRSNGSTVEIIDRIFPDPVCSIKNFLFRRVLRDAVFVISVHSFLCGDISFRSLGIFFLIKEF